MGRVGCDNTFNLQHVRCNYTFVVLDDNNKTWNMKPNWMDHNILIDRRQFEVFQPKQARIVSSFSFGYSDYSYEK